MAKKIFVKDLSKYTGQEVTLQGWVRNYRKASSKLRFVIFRDGTCEVQAVAYEPELGEENFEKVKTLTLESSLIITGIPKKHPNFENQYELQMTGIEIIHISEDYPIGKKDHGVDFLLSNRHLWLRSSKQNALMKIRHTVYFAICEFLNENGFFRFDSPILTPNACEGTTTLFEVPYFDQGKAYLSQSGQLYLEAGIMSLGRVYDFGPVFRAEKSKTRKHLTEFWMMDAEAAYVEHKENMRIQEKLIRFVIKSVLKHNLTDLQTLERNIEALRKADAPFKIITYKKMIKILQQKGIDIHYGDDMGAREEELLVEDLDVPIFVEKWPKHIKPFYMKVDPRNPKISLGSDLIAPEGFGEIIGGSQREDNYNILKKRMEEDEIPINDYQWYLDLRRYGSVPHSGFGVGLERIIGWMSGVRHIRETIPFPRMLYRIYP